MRNRFAGLVALGLACMGTACGSESDGSTPSGSGDATTDSSTASHDDTATGSDSASATDSDAGAGDTTPDATPDSTLTDVADGGSDAAKDTSVLAAADTASDGPFPATTDDFDRHFFLHDGTLYWVGGPRDFHIPTMTLHSVPTTGGVVADVVTDLQGPRAFAVVGDHVHFLDTPPSSSDVVLVRVPLGVGPTTTETVATYSDNYLAMAANKDALYLSGDRLVDYLPLPISTGATPAKAFHEGFVIRDLAFTDTEVLWLGQGSVYAGGLESSSGLRRPGWAASSFDGSFHLAGANAYWVTRDDDLVYVPIAGSGATAKTVVHLAGATGTMSWDGDILYYVSPTGIMRVDTSGATPTPFVSGPAVGAIAFAFDATNVYWMSRTGIYKATK